MGYNFLKQEAFLNARINEAEAAEHGYFYSVTRNQLFAVADGGTTVIFDIIRPRRTSKGPDGEPLYHFTSPKKRPVLDTARQFGASCVLLVVVTVPKPIAHVLPLSRPVWTRLNEGAMSLDDFILPCDQTLVSQAMLVTHGSRVAPLEAEVRQGPNGKLFHAIQGKVGMEADRESVTVGHQEFGTMRVKLPKGVKDVIDFAAPFFTRNDAR